MLEYATKEVEVATDEFFATNLDTSESICIEGCGEKDKIQLSYLQDRVSRPIIRFLTFNQLKQLLFSKYLGEENNDSREND